MSLVDAGFHDIEFETPAQALRREIMEHAQRAYDRSLRMRRVVIASSLVFSLSQTAYTIVQPGDGELPLGEAITWGVPLVASLLAMSLVWCCRVHLDQGQHQYVTFLRATAQAA